MLHFAWPILTGPLIVGLYSNDAIIIENSSMALKIIALVQPLQSSQLILAGALRGAGDTLWPLVTTFKGVFGFRVLLAHILANIMGYGLMGGTDCATGRPVYKISVCLWQI